MPFVSIEGIDGSGKTEQVTRLVQRLKTGGHPVLQTKEPDGGRLGREVRAMLTRTGRSLDPVEQLLLVSAARFDHVHSVIRPALKDGYWVISDRFIDSTFAFQVAVSEMDLSDLFLAVREVVVGSTLPDLTIILDLPLEVATARREARDSGSYDPSELQRDFSRIRETLVGLAVTDPDRCRIINSDRSAEEVSKDIWRLVERMF